MSRYIDVDALINDIPKEYHGSTIHMMINKAPSIDIVFCKECKYAHMTYGGECKYCDIWFPDEPVYLRGDDYCSFGERKESE